MCWAMSRARLRLKKNSAPIVSIGKSFRTTSTTSWSPQKIVAKALSRVAPGYFRDGCGVVFKNSEARSLQRIVAELDAEKACDLAQLPLALARERLASAIALSHAFFEGRYRHAGAEPDRRHLIVCRPLLQNLRDTLGQVRRPAHIAISGTPASVRS